MKIVRILSCGVVLALLIGGRPLLAEGWSLQNLLPFGKKQTKKPARTTTVKRGPLEQLDAGMKKLGEGTKKFFVQTRDLLTGKKPAARRHPNYSRRYPRIRHAGDPRYSRSKPKQSWLDTLLGREKPKPVRSMKEWVGLPRPKS